LDCTSSNGERGAIGTGTIIFDFTLATFIAVGAMLLSSQTAVADH
jgi:hypothetical protein